MWVLGTVPGSPGKQADLSLLSIFPAPMVGYLKVSEIKCPLIGFLGSFVSICVFWCYICFVCFWLFGTYEKCIWAGDRGSAMNSRPAWANK